MYRVLTPEAETLSSILDIPSDHELNTSGLITPKGIGTIATPEKAGQILTPRGYAGKREVIIPEEEDVLKYQTHQEGGRRTVMPSGEVARAFGNFDAYFAGKVREYFPSHQGMQPSTKQSYQRVYEEKSYFDRTSGNKKAVRISKPGWVEEECLTAIRIAGEPTFAGTVVVDKAISRASALLKVVRIGIDGGCIPRVPEMPDFLAETEGYLTRLHTQRKLRFEVYDLINQTEIPASGISDLGKRIDAYGDLKHPLAYRLLTEADTDTAWYKEQMDRREKLLSLLDGDPQRMLEMYPDLKKLAEGLVCSMDVNNPPKGKVGVEIEFGEENTPFLRELPHFNTYRDCDNREISRDINLTNLNGTYLRDLSNLAAYLRDGATHISSLHLHLDRNQHPFEPNIGSLLGNSEERTVEESYDKPTWEVRGLLPPIYGKELDPAGVVDIIQLYISAASTKGFPVGSEISISEGSEPTIEQIIFVHICRFISSSEGRLAALKILEHPFVLKAVNPLALISDYVNQDQEKVYKIMKKGLFGKFARQALRDIKRNCGFEKVTYERLTDVEISLQYENQVKILEETGVLHRLESGELGIVGIDGKEHSMPDIETVLAQVRERSETLGPKMEQGFRKLLIVPFGMKLEELASIYGKALVSHYREKRLLVTKEDSTDPNINISLNTLYPISLSSIYEGADTSGRLVYYPREPSDWFSGQTKNDILASGESGWKILLVEDLPNLPANGFGEIVGGRPQLEAGESPGHYLRVLKTNPKYVGETGMTPEDWLIYALTYLEETNQVIDNWINNGKEAFLLGAFFEPGYVPIGCWDRNNYCARLSDFIYAHRDYDHSARVAVRVG